MAEKEYIERGSALFELETGWFPQSMEYTEAVGIARSILKAAPAADVVEVRHGEWVDEYEGKYDNALYVCSVCRAKAFYMQVIDVLQNWHTIQARTPFCPCCGAKMDGKGGSNDEVH